MTAPRTAVHASGTRRRTPATRTVKRRRTTTRPTRRPTSRRRPARAPKGKAGTQLHKWWPALLIAAAALVGLAWDTTESVAAPAPTPGVPPGHCVIAGTGDTLTIEQFGNAKIIAQVAQDRGLPGRAVVIGLATAQQESRLRNLDYGDRDSLGLFQQRPSQGWGTEAQVQDPVYAAGKFYDGLVKVPAWDTARVTDAADAVQRSAFPEAYEQWGGMAQSWAEAILSGDPAAITCALS